MCSRDLFCIIGIHVVIARVCVNYSLRVICINFFAEADRDAVICVYQERGADARITGDQVSLARKQIVDSTVEADKRSRSGYEMEKSVFLEKYKDEPEIFKKGKVVSSAGERREWPLEI